MPNFFMFMGPNATIGHGSLIYSLDWTAEWIVQWLRKMAREDIASVAPKQDVVDELVRYGDEVMKTLTWTGNCKSSQRVCEPSLRSSSLLSIPPHIHIYILILVSARVNRGIFILFLIRYSYNIY
jgi:hypothetical protein